MLCRRMINIGTDCTNESFMMTTKPICNTQGMFVALYLETSHHLLLFSLDNFSEFLIDCYIFLANWTCNHVRLRLNFVYNASNA